MEPGSLLGIIYPMKAWREQKPAVTVLVDLHYQHEVLHSSLKLLLIANL